MRVINRREYRQQGEPDIGFGPTLSKFDVTQLNRLYSCPRSGVPGYLTVHVRKAKNVKQMANAYVMVTAYDDKRNVNGIPQRERAMSTVQMIPSLMRFLNLAARTRGSTSR